MLGPCLEIRLGVCLFLGLATVVYALASGALSVVVTIVENDNGTIIEEPPFAASFLHVQFDAEGFTSENAVGSYGETGDT